jgi:hypothetical protein
MTIIHLQDQRPASGRANELLHVLHVNLMYIMLIMKVAWERDEACEFVRHRMHTSYLPWMEFPIIQLSIRAVRVRERDKL